MGKDEPLSYLPKISEQLFLFVSDWWVSSDEIWSMCQLLQENKNDFYFGILVTSLNFSGVEK